MKNHNLLVETEDKNLLRDVNSKALINKNNLALASYKSRKQIFENIKEEKEETKIRLAKLESDIQDIKNLLVEIAALKK